MHYHTALAIAASAALFMVSSVVMAQDAEPSYKADPSVYKVIFENQSKQIKKRVSATRHILIPFSRSFISSRIVAKN